MKSIALFSLTALVIAAPCATSFAHSPATTPASAVAAPTPIVDLQPVGTLVTNDQRISHFRDMIKAAKLENVFNAHGAFTVFAPSNKALTSLPNDIARKIEKDAKYRKDFILSHIFPGKMSTEFLKKTDAIRALSTHKFLVRDDERQLMVNNHSFLAQDINASNGILHIVDGPFLQKD